MNKMLCELLMIQQTVSTESVKETMSLLDIVLKGGYMLIPLLLLSIASFYIFFEKLFVLRRAAKTPDGFIEQIKGMVLDGRISEARAHCSTLATPIAKMIDKGISRIGSPLKNIEASIENVGKIELYSLEKNLSLLATISGAAPMIGFLGTVTGMIQAFMSIAQEEGTVSPKLLSSGIYEAMISTAVGLIVGILSYLAYNYLVTRVAKLIHKMEYSSVSFIDLLQEPHQK